MPDQLLDSAQAPLMQMAHVAFGGPITREDDYWQMLMLLAGDDVLNEGRYAHLMSYVSARPYAPDDVMYTAAFAREGIMLEGGPDLAALSAQMPDFCQRLYRSGFGAFKRVLIDEYRAGLHILDTDDAALFEELVMPFLLADEVANTILYGLIHTLRTHPALFNDVHLMLVSYRHNQQPIGVAVRTGGGALTLSAFTEAGSSGHAYPQAIDVLAEALMHHTPPLKSITGPTRECHRFAATWELLTGQAIAADKPDLLYRLDTLIPVRGVPGALHFITPADFDRAVQWRAEFTAEAHGGPLDLIAAARTIHWALDPDMPMRHMALWVVDGVPVSLGGVGVLTSNGGRIGPIYTPPALRGNGYASAITAALSDWLLSVQGKAWVVLYTDAHNPIANKIYQRLGYVLVGHTTQIEFNVG